jgi:hypothetical protein
MTPVALALAFPATAIAVADFKTPHGAAYCGISHGEPPERKERKRSA